MGLALLTPLVMIAIHRFYRRANLGLSDAPLETLTSDRALLASMASTEADEAKRRQGMEPA